MSWRCGQAVVNSNMRSKLVPFISGLHCWPNASAARSYAFWRPTLLEDHELGLSGFSYYIACRPDKYNAHTTTWKSNLAVISPLQSGTRRRSGSEARAMAQWKFHRYVGVSLHYDASLHIHSLLALEITLHALLPPQRAGRWGWWRTEAAIGGLITCPSARSHVITAIVSEV